MGNSRTVDIHVQDTYYVIAQAHILWLFAFFTWFLGLIYLLTRKLLFSKTLTWIHVILSILSVFFLLFLMFFSGTIPNEPPNQHLDYNNWNTFDEYDHTMRMIAYTTITLLLAQVVLLVNILGGFFKRR